MVAFFGQDNSESSTNRTFRKTLKNLVGIPAAYRCTTAFLPVEKSTSIQRQILDYLTSNPAAQDTARGIVEWWLLKQNVMRSMADVEEALEKLVAERKISTRAGPDGQVHYFSGADRARGLAQKPGDFHGTKTE